MSSLELNESPLDPAASHLHRVFRRRRDLWKRGFRPVALYNHTPADVPDHVKPNNRGKQPVGKNWDGRARYDPPEAAVLPPDAGALNTGILCDGLRAIDIDVEDEAVVQQIVRHLTDCYGEAPIRYRFDSPRVLILYRAADGEPGKRSKAGPVSKVEILGKGNQLAAFGQHNKHGAVLEWRVSVPDAIARDALPSLTEADVTEILAFVAPLIGAKPEGEDVPIVGVPSRHGQVAKDFSALVDALNAIPNDGFPEWEAWNRIGLALWGAMDGSEEGREAFHTWSALNRAYDADETEERWLHYRRSPPTRSGAGTIIAEARRHGWRGRPGAFSGVVPPSGCAPIKGALEADIAPVILDPSAPMVSARAFIELRHTREGRPILQYQGGSFYRWGGTHYAEVTADDMKSQVWKFLEPALRLVKDGPAPFNPSKARVADVLEATGAACQMPGQMRAPCWMTPGPHPAPGGIVACANGLLDLATGRLSPPTPDFFTLNSLPFDYDPDAPEPAAWLRFLETLWSDDRDSRSTLQEIIGLLLTGETRYQKAFLLVGPKRSGKGTIARVLTQLLGAANVCGPTLAQLGSQFGSAPLIGKRLAIIADARLGARADSEAVAERILNITGEDSQTIDRKFREAWTGKLDARLLIISNELPRLSDASGALPSRLVTLVLTESFYNREDQTLTDRLICELPGILNWAIAGWHQLAARGRFVPPRASEDAQRELEDLGSPISVFIRDRCATGPGEVVSMDALYLAWRLWCQGEGRNQPGTKATFGRDLRAALPTLTDENRRENDNKRVRYYKGLSLSVAGTRGTLGTPASPL